MKYFFFLLPLLNLFAVVDLVVDTPGDAFSTTGGIEFEQGLFLIRGKASYVYKALYHTSRVSAVIVGAPSSFLVEALTGHQNLGLGSLELTWRSLTGGYFSLFYTGEFGSGYASNELTARLGKKF